MNSGVKIMLGIRKKKRWRNSDEECGYQWESSESYLLKGACVWGSSINGKSVLIDRHSTSHPASCEGGYINLTRPRSDSDNARKYNTCSYLHMDLLSTGTLFGHPEIRPTAHRGGWERDIKIEEDLAVIQFWISKSGATSEVKNR